MSKILEITDPEGLRFVERSDFAAEAMISPQEFDHMLRLCGGLWLHSGDRSAPHAELTSGKYSDGFVNTLLLLKYPAVNMLLAEELAWIFNEERGSGPDWVIGSDHAAATLSFAVARYLNAKHAFTEKGPDGKTQLWKRETIGEDEVVLQVEELVTTTATLDRVRTGIVAGNAHPVQFAPQSLALVHRSPTARFGEGPILHFRHYDINVWEPADCPLCAAGSERLRPKEKWAQLTAV
jgi:orotate phosphoribosyltransferase